uniref:Secreted protein n=1 Tax=Heterorhabditis bacteriophora TaxID=37862 RepID=A0A1I7WJI9_HETBA
MTSRYLLIFGTSVPKSSGSSSAPKCQTAEANASAQRSTEKSKLKPTREDQKGIGRSRYHDLRTIRVASYHSATTIPMSTREWFDISTLFHAVSVTLVYIFTFFQVLLCYCFRTYQRKSLCIPMRGNSSTIKWKYFS